MSIHHIKTPAGFKTKNASFAFDPGFGAEWSAWFGAAQVNWPAVASAAILAGVLSLLTSLAGLPELKGG